MISPSLGSIRTLLTPTFRARFPEFNAVWMRLQPRPKRGCCGGVAEIDAGAVVSGFAAVASSLSSARKRELAQGLGDSSILVNDKSGTRVIKL